MSLAKLEEFFEKTEIPDRLILNECEVISDLPNLIKTHLGYLHANSGNLAYKPYYDRLLKIYNKLNEDTH